MRTPALLCFLAAMLLGACASKQAAYDRALDQPTPPADFWLGVTVLGPLRSTGYAHLPRAQRPARYVVESDRVLRAAMGPGASEQVFPPRLRTLSDEQWANLWGLVRSAGLAREAGEPYRVSTAPTLEEAPGRSAIVISYVAAGVRRSLAVDLAEGESDEGARVDAMRIADAMSDLAWVK